MEKRRYPAFLALHFDVSDVAADRSMLERHIAALLSSTSAPHLGAVPFGK